MASVADRQSLVPHDKAGLRSMPLDQGLSETDIYTGASGASSPSYLRGRASVAPRRSRSSAPCAGDDPNYSVYQDWSKASEKSRALFRELKRLGDQLGEVRTDPVATGVSFQVHGFGGNRRRVIAHVYLRVRSGLRVLIHADLVRDMPIEDGLNRPWACGPYREIVIREREQIRRAEPLLHEACDGLSRVAS